MQCDEVALLADFVHAGAGDAEILGKFVIKIWIGCEDLHAKTGGSAGHAFSYRAKPDNSQCLAEDVDAGILAPVLLAAFVVDEHDFAGYGKHETEGKVSNGIAVCTHSTGHTDAALFAFFEIDIVKADAVTGDGLEFGGVIEDILVAGINAEYHGVAVGDHPADRLLGKDGSGVIPDDFEAACLELIKKSGVVFAERAGGNKNLFHRILLRD